MTDDASLISGVVLDEQGRPVAEAAIYFTDGPVALQDVATLTDANGEFALAAPAPGTYTLRCNAAGFRAAPADVTVSRGEEKRLEINLRK